MAQSALPDPAKMCQALEFTWQDAKGLTWDVRQTQEPSGPMVQRYVGGIFRQSPQVGVTRRLVRTDPQGRAPGRAQHD